MKKSLLSAAVVAAMLVVSLPAMAADTAQVRATKAAKIVEIMRPNDFAALEDFKTRQLLYEKLGPDMGGNAVLQQAMADYSDRDNASGLKQHALAVFEGREYRASGTAADTTVQDPFAEDVKAEEDGQPLTMREKLEQMKIEEKMKLSGAPAIGVAPGHVYIPAKTRFKMELVNAASSKTLKKGEELDIRMADNLIVNGVIVIPKGAVGKAYVYDSSSAAGMGQGGFLKIAAREIKTINNVKVPLRLGLVGKGHGDPGAAAVFTFISMLGGAFMKGTNASYTAGTAFTVEVTENVDLQTNSADLAKVMNPAIPHGTEININVR